MLICAANPQHKACRWGDSKISSTSKVLIYEEWFHLERTSALLQVNAVLENLKVATKNLMDCY